MVMIVFCSRDEGGGHPARGVERGAVPRPDDAHAQREGAVSQIPVRRQPRKYCTNTYYKKHGQRFLYWVGLEFDSFCAVDDHFNPSTEMIANLMIVNLLIYLTIFFFSCHEKFYACNKMFVSMFDMHKYK